MTPFLEIDRQAVLTRLHAQGLKRWWVAEEAGIHKTTLRRWLSGRIRRVRAERVLSLARVLETDPAALARSLTDDKAPVLAASR